MASATIRRFEPIDSSMTSATPAVRAEVTHRRGASVNSGQGAPNAGATQTWMDFLKANNISHCNWSVADLDQGSAGLLRGASPQGGWTDAQLSQSGQLVKNIISNG
jgi:hypothetical protein